MRSSRVAVLRGFSKTSAVPALIPRTAIGTSPRSTSNRTGSLAQVAVNLASRSGSVKSRARAFNTRQPRGFDGTAPSHLSRAAKVSALKPADAMSSESESRIAGSSLTTNTVVSAIYAPRPGLERAEPEKSKCTFLGDALCIRIALRLIGRRVRVGKSLDEVKRRGHSFDYQAYVRSYRPWRQRRPEECRSLPP